MEFYVSPSLVLGFCLGFVFFFYSLHYTYPHFESFSNLSVEIMRSLGVCQFK